MNLVSVVSLKFEKLIIVILLFFFFFFFSVIIKNKIKSRITMMS